MAQDTLGSEKPYFSRVNEEGEKSLKEKEMIETIM
jgi:hypothetical protein